MAFNSQHKVYHSTNFLMLLFGNFQRRWGHNFTATGIIAIALHQLYCKDGIATIAVHNCTAQCRRHCTTNIQYKHNIIIELLKSMVLVSVLIIVGVEICHTYHTGSKSPNLIILCHTLSHWVKITYFDHTLSHFVTLGQNHLF